MVDRVRAAIVYRGCVVITPIVNVVRAWRIAIALVLSSTYAAYAAPVQVPMLLIDSPPTFDATRFSTSLETYVTNAMVIVASGAKPSDACADALLRASAVASSTSSDVPVALWAHWSEGPEPRTMTVSMVTVEKGCGAIESSTVDVPAEQPDFVYRVAALKIASLLRVIPDSPEAAPISSPVDAATRKRLVWGGGPAVVRYPFFGEVDLGVTGVASTEESARTYALHAGFWLHRPFPGWWPRFSLGTTVVASAAHEADAPGGSGSARLVGVLVGARARIVYAGRIAVIAELDAGAATVWSSADRSNGADAMSERVWTPIASFAPHVRLALSRRFHLAAGPTLDISRSIDLRLGDTALYHASWLRFRWDIRAQLWF